jgi:hypothetical protein
MNKKKKGLIIKFEEIVRSYFDVKKFLIICSNNYIFSKLDDFYNCNEFFEVEKIIEGWELGRDSN